VELHNSYFSPNISPIGVIKPRRTSWFGQLAHVEYSRNAYKILFGTLEERVPLGIPMRRLWDNIKIDFKEM
jgi:hypothetical protein